VLSPGGRPLPARLGGPRNTRSRQFLLLCSGVLAAPAPAQFFDDASLSGRYYFVELQVTASDGRATDGRNLSGTITFDGRGGYTFTGRQGVGSGAPAVASGAGTYSVASAGGVAMASPIRANLQVRAWLSGDRNVVVGASTEANDNVNDIFVAIRAPAANLTNAVLNGNYTGGYISFPDGRSDGVRSAVVTLTAAGDGRFSRVTALGHAFDQGGRNIMQDDTASTYAINGDGTGTANFGVAASLFSAARDIFISPDGSYLIGTSNATGLRDIFFATRNYGTSASAQVFDGRYSIVELNVERPSSLANDLSFSVGSGTIQALGNGRALIAERLRLNRQPLDVSLVNTYLVNADSTGSLGPVVVAGVSNMALGVSTTVDGTTRPYTVVGAQVGAVGSITNLYGIFFAVRSPSFSGAGVFLHPNGVVSNASRAPAPNPIAPGSIVELYGSGLAPGNVEAPALPLPTTLQGVSVTVAGRLAPLFFVSPGQINIQVPFEVSGGGTTTIQVTNGGMRSNEVVVPVAATGPGVYAYADAESQNRALVTHANGSLVTPQSPALPGETVILYVTGLGVLNPAVASGAANPGVPPLALAVDPNIRIFFGGEPAGTVPFIGGAPLFAGLNQINVVIPVTVIGGTNVPVAIATSNAFTDLVDIPIGN